MSLSVAPITFRAAAAFVAEHHRHLPPARGTRFCVSVTDEEGTVRGVAMVGRPVSRHLDDGVTVEVNRCCTDGARNACSMLYGAAWRAARALGYRRLVTYTLSVEGGASLRAAGFVRDGARGGGEWSRGDRPRQKALLPETKIRWTIELSARRAA